MKVTRAYCRGCCRDVATLETEAGWRCGICERLIAPAVVVNATPDAVSRFVREAHRLIDLQEMDTLPTIGGNPISGLGKNK